MRPTQEVDTRWNSTFVMLQRLFEQREPRGSLCQCLAFSRSFHQATVKLSEKRRVSGSKAIPITKMLRHVITAECAKMAPSISATLANHSKNNLNEKLAWKRSHPCLWRPSWIHAAKRLDFVMQVTLRLLLKGWHGSVPTLLNMSWQKMFLQSMHLPVKSTTTCGLCWTAM